MDKKNKIKELVDLLNQYSFEYYTLDSPTISDKEYDSLYDTLLTLEKETGIVLEDSPTKRVGGATLKEFKQKEHIRRLYSLDKCQQEEDLEKWLEKQEEKGIKEYSLEYKYDGLTVSLTYENKRLVQALTRGDGIIGEDILEQVKTIKTIPLKINFEGRVDIQGEGIMRLSALEKYNSENDEILKNARNAAAGAIRNLNPKITAKRNLDFVAYNISYIENKNFKTQEEVNQFLKDNKFFTGGYFKVLNNKKEIIKALNNIEKERDKLDYLIDGAVLKMNEINVRNTLGFTDKFPRWAMAYKFKAEEVTTTLKDVIWQVSRTGKLNPLAILEPVDICGVTVKRCTLSNISEIKRKQLMINSKVFIRRSNDVIPEILGVAKYLENKKEIIPPKFCPYCGSQIVEDSVFIYCSNKEHCAPAVISKIEHYTEKNGADIEGLSERTIEQFYNDLGLRKISDLFYLKKEDLLTLEGFKEKKAQNILDSIKKSKNIDFDRFIYAIGIPNIGKKTARDLAEKFKTIDNLKGATYNDLIEMQDFGPVMANCLIEFFKDKDNIEELDKLLINLNIKEIETNKINNEFFNNKTFVITGTLDTLSRKEAQDLILKNGGKTSESVSKNTACLIAGKDCGSKLEKAKNLGIDILSEKEFLDKIGKI